MEVANLLTSRKYPVIVVDGGMLLHPFPYIPRLILITGAVRFDLLNETQEIIESLQIPYFSTAMSKGSISEQLGNGKLFGGVYSGGASPDTIRAAVEKSELVLFIGNYPVSLRVSSTGVTLANLGYSPILIRMSFVYILTESYLLISRRGEFTTQLEGHNIVDFQRFSVNVAGKSYDVTSKYVRSLT